MDEVLSATLPVFSIVMNAELTSPCTKDEVWSMVNQMHPYKAPRPDGMHAIFYKKFSHIVGDDVATVVIGIIPSRRPLDVSILLWLLGSLR